MLHLLTDMLFAAEVKGTLRPRRIPRMTRVDLQQMSSAWLDKPDNPGMSPAGLDSEDVSGPITVLNFGDMTLRMSMTAGFASWRPVLHRRDVHDPT